MTVVGFGEAGSRMVDKLASLKDINGNSLYNVLTVTNSSNELIDLLNLPKENQFSFSLGMEDSFRRNPKKAFTTLEKEQEINKNLYKFIRNRARPTDHIVLFFAALDDSTGTATIVHAVKSHMHKPLTERLRKIGLVVTLPALLNGPKVLRQAHDFAHQLQELANTPNSNIEYVIIADNQTFFLKWIQDNFIKNEFSTYHDYANREILSIFTEELFANY